jgi:hypothetical protein
MKTKAQAFAACAQHTAFVAPGDLNSKAYPAKTYEDTFDHQIYSSLSNRLNNCINLHDQNINPSNVTGYFMNCPPWYSKVLRSAHKVYICLLYGSQNKERVFSYATLTD